MTAEDVKRAILSVRYPVARTVVPNYTPDGWWECDLFEVTHSGCFKEYEFKVSRSDFFADAAKAVGRRAWLKGTLFEAGEPKPQTKHGRLASGDTSGPVQFWFAVPAGLVKAEEVPAWAGLLEVHSLVARRHHRAGVREAVKAPRLHAGKVDQKVEAHARGVCYYRYLNGILDPRKEKQKTDLPQA